MEEYKNFSAMLIAIANQHNNAFIAGTAKRLQYELAALDDPKLDRYISDEKMQIAVTRGTKLLLTD
jgi:hypothetical protein